MFLKGRTLPRLSGASSLLSQSTSPASHTPASSSFAFTSARPRTFLPTKQPPHHLSIISRSYCSQDAGSSSTTNSNSSCSSTPSPKMADQDITRYLKETHARVFENNRAWAEAQKAKDPEFFNKMSAGQTPEYLWIGCSDSRIPAEQITGLGPGETFVHRNIANMVNNIDFNVSSVINFAVDHLKVKHIIVCGHYGCGGVKAAMTASDLGILNPWLRNIRDVARLHEAELDSITDEAKKNDRLVELNVIEQCKNVIKDAAVQKSFAANKYPIVHGWVFDFKTGLLTDLKFGHEGALRDIQKLYDITK